MGLAGERLNDVPGVVEVGRLADELAVRIDGKPYLVNGSNIDDHGDAHASDGLCNAIRRAKVTGEIKDDRFVAEGFELLPLGDTDTD